MYFVFLLKLGTHECIQVLSFSDVSPPPSPHVCVWNEMQLLHLCPTVHITPGQIVKGVLQGEMPYSIVI